MPLASLLRLLPSAESREKSIARRNVKARFIDDTVNNVIIPRGFSAIPHRRASLIGAAGIYVYIYLGFVPRRRGMPRIVRAHARANEFRARRVPI